MANFHLERIDDLIRELDEAGNLDEIAPEMIEAALPILEDSLKETVQNEANKGYATGELVASIKKSRSMRNQYGYFGVVRPTGTDKKGVRNMEKLAYLHYGICNKQEARPVVNKAVFHAEEKVIKKMQEVYNKGGK